MKVRWTASARLDRLDIADHIAADSPRAAARMDALFTEAAESLVSRFKSSPTQDCSTGAL
ncbi:type II toxin-antitoxin system RelE/ParE family toxin [Caulobacter sp. LARHSG274]